MTLEQTRQLGIEFERRVQTMIPDKEYAEKLDTETIYSYLNQFQDKLVHDTYKALDNIPPQSKPSIYIENILKGLVDKCSVDLTKVDDKKYIYTAQLPANFGLYLISTTDVERMYEYKKGTNSHAGTVTNAYIPQSTEMQFAERPFDPMRIVRYPIVQLYQENDRTNIKLMCDQYTSPTKVNVTYYKIPRYMDLMTSTPCELSIDAFDDLVTGAVDLYVQYVAGAEARKRQLVEQQNKNNKNKEDRDERD